MIKILKLTKKYEKCTAINDLSVEIKQGEIIAIVGPNGAGKSTLLKSICGMLKLDNGKILIGGLNHNSIEAKNKLSYAPELPVLYDYLTLNEHLNFIVSAYRLTQNLDLIEDYLEKLDLKSKLNIVTKQFSKGQKQKTSLLLAFLINKPVLILDEPFTGIDPSGIYEIKERLKKFKEEGKTVIISTHLLDMVKDLVDRFLIISKGVIKADIKDGSFENIEKVYMDVTEC